MAVCLEKAGRASRAKKHEFDKGHYKRLTIIGQLVVGWLTEGSELQLEYDIVEIFPKFGMLSLSPEFQSFSPDWSKDVYEASFGKRFGYDKRCRSDGSETEIIHRVRWKNETSKEDSNRWGHWMLVCRNCPKVHSGLIVKQLSRRILKWATKQLPPLMCLQKWRTLLYRKDGTHFCLQTVKWRMDWKNVPGRPHDRWIWCFLSGRLGCKGVVGVYYNYYNYLKGDLYLIS